MTSSRCLLFFGKVAKWQGNRLQPYDREFESHLFLQWSCSSVGRAAD